MFKKTIQEGSIKKGGQKPTTQTPRPLMAQKVKDVVVVK